jgi:hypothetical protein
MGRHVWIAGRGLNPDEGGGDHPIGSVRALSTSELFLISAIRLWCGSSGSVACRRTLVRNGFRAAGLDERDYVAFSQVMTTFMAAAYRPLCVAAGASGAVLRDEGAMLEILGMWQAGQVQAATQMMATMLPPAAVRLCAPAAADVAESLAAVGLTLCPRTIPSCETRDLLLKARVLH